MEKLNYDKFPLMLIENVTIRIKAGDGGRGAVAFNKIKMSLGPAGGDGGGGRKNFPYCFYG